MFCAKSGKAAVRKVFLQKKLQPNEMKIKGFAKDKSALHNVEESNVNIFEAFYFKLNQSINYLT